MCLLAPLPQPQQLASQHISSPVMSGSSCTFPQLFRNIASSTPAKRIHALEVQPSYLLVFLTIEDQGGCQGTPTVEASLVY